MKNSARLLLTLIFFVFTNGAGADTSSFRSTNLPLPRFASLKSDTVYARTGPGRQYPVRWEYKRKDLPLEIIKEFETWRKIRDSAGDEGWIHTSMLSGRRTGLIHNNSPVVLFDSPKKMSSPYARIEEGSVVLIDSCRKSWCRITAKGFTGWIERKYLWGVYESEDFD